MWNRTALAALGSLLAAAAVVTGVASSRWESAAALNNCETSSAALNSAEQNVLELLNAYRQQNGAAPLKVSPNLSRAAAFMTEDMLAKNYFDHFEPNGRSPFTRAVDCGYPSQNVGENLAKSFSGTNAIALWKTSPGHNAAMLNKNWKVVGIGNAGGYWALDFGVLDDSGSAPAPSTPSSSASPSPTSTPTATPTPTRRTVVVQMLAVE